MPAILGSGEHRYRVVENWAKLPPGWTLTDVASVAVDSKDRVYAFNRGAHPMIVFDRDGNFIRSWGEGLFHRAHGLHIDADDNLYCTDDGDHTVRKCSGRRQGAADHRHPEQAGAVHERRAVPPLHPHGAVAKGRDLCVGRLRQCLRAQILARRQADEDLGRVRHRSRRVQHRPQYRRRRRRLGLCRRPREPSRAGVRRQRQVRDAVEQPAPALRAVLLRRQAAAFHHRRAGPRHAGQPKAHQPRPAPDHRRPQGQALARLGGEAGPGLETGKFLSPHGIALDSKGSIYVGEVGVTNWKTSFPDTPMPDEVGAVRCLQKLEKI